MRWAVGRDIIHVHDMGVERQDSTDLSPARGGIIQPLGIDQSPLVIKWPTVGSIAVSMQGTYRPCTAQPRPGTALRRVPTVSSSVALTSLPEMSSLSFQPIFV